MPAGEDGGLVTVHGLATFAWDAGDEGGCRLAAVQLVRLRAASLGQVAEVFGVDPGTIWRWDQALAAGRVAGLVPREGPNGASKLTPELVKRIADGAKAAVLALLPEGAEAHPGKSKTLEDAGISGKPMGSGRYNFLRTRLRQMNRETRAGQIRKLGAAPDFMLGSVQAVTEAGQLMAASGSGSRIGPYASGAGQLILVIGAQKVVPDLDAALRRIAEHVQPYGDMRLRELIGEGTQLARVLILERDFRPGRTTIILVREPIGV